MTIQAFFKGDPFNGLTLSFLFCVRVAWALPNRAFGRLRGKLLSLPY
jgi:hypothetical protein